MGHQGLSISPNLQPNPFIDSSDPACAAAGGIPESPYLGVEEMMVLLSTRLGKLDDEVKTMMAEQQARINQRSAIKDFENAMGKYQPPKSDAEYQAMHDEMQKAIDTLRDEDPIRRQLEAKLAYFDKKNEARTKTTDDGSLSYYFPSSKDEWLADKQSVADMADNLGDQSEIEMLKLQSHMTKRTTLVQLTTNIVQKLEAAPDMIAKNI